MRVRSRRSGEGAILLGTILILLTISLLGAASVSFFLSVTTVTEVELYRAQALYLAEAGIAQAIHQLRRSSRMGGEAPQKSSPTPLGEGEYEVVHDLSAGLITSTGRVHGVRRTIQVKYLSFG